METPVTFPPSEADALATLQKAIRNQQVVQFKTDMGWRTVEPYKVGYAKGDPLHLLVYGYSRDTVVNEETPSRWQIFQLSDMQRLSLTTYFFKAHHDYRDPTGLSNSLSGQLVWFSHGIIELNRPARMNSN